MTPLAPFKHEHTQEKLNILMQGTFVWHREKIIFLKGLDIDLGSMRYYKESNKGDSYDRRR